MPEHLIAALDPAGIPGPIWLFQGLLLLTFFLHLLFMNLTLGGTLMAAVAHSHSTSKADDPRGALAKRMVAVNGFGISMTITTGVAPLLFIQLLYQQFFYTATILLSWMWFSLLVFLTVAYYAIYVFKFRDRPGQRFASGLWLWLAAIFFLIIGAIQVAVHLAHAQPSSWSDLNNGSWQVLLDPSFLPRWLHFVLAGISMSAVLHAWWAARQAGRDINTTINTGIARYARRWALWSTAALIVDGFVLLAALPHEVLVGFMRGGAATIAPFTVAVVLGIVLLVVIKRAVDPTANPAAVGVALAAVSGVIALMIVMRQQIRDLYLGDALDFESVRVVPQWGNFVLFAVLLVAGLATVYLLVRKVLAEPAYGDEAA